MALNSYEVIVPIEMYLVLSTAGPAKNTRPVGTWD